MPQHVHDMVVMSPNLTFGMEPPESVSQGKANTDVGQRRSLVDIEPVDCTQW